MKKLIIVCMLAITGMISLNTQAALLVTEQFDYTNGTYVSTPSGGNPPGYFLTLNGGVGWQRYWDGHVTPIDIVISAGPAGGMFDGPSFTTFQSSYFRSRPMSAGGIGTVADGELVAWNSMYISSAGSGNGGIRVIDPNGGTSYNIRFGSGNVYELGGGHNTPEVNTSTTTATTDSNDPDLVLVKVENTYVNQQQKASVWINPDITQGEAGLGTPDMTVSYSVFTSRKLGGININPSGFRIDELLFGETFKDVTQYVPPVPPYNPSPSDGAADISVSKTLLWQNEDADSYKVYVWKSGDSKPATPTATVTNTWYDPPANLEYNTTYLWQVVVVKGGSEAAGAEWSFTTGDTLPPGAVSVPVPSDGSNNVSTRVTLGWDEAARATAYYVYLWKSADSKPATPTATVLTTEYTPPSRLDFDTAYTWHVAAINDYGTNATASEWEFNTELLVNSPEPADGSDAMLAWMPVRWFNAPGVSSYDVFIWPGGEAKPATPVDTVATNFYFPYVYLSFDSTYHWQIIANLSGGGTVEGPEWTFATEAESQTTVTPAFDIAPSAQTARVSLYTSTGRDVLSGPTTTMKTGMKISMFGDSITWQNVYITRIQNALNGGAGTSGLGVQLVNHGINGGGVEQVRDGEDANTGYGGVKPQPFYQTITNDGANIAVVFIGINDVWWRGTSEAAFEQALRDIIASAETATVRMVLATLTVHGEKPDGTNGDDPKIEIFAQITRDVAADTGCVLVELRKAYIGYLQNYNYQLNADGTLNVASSGFLTYDGVHPTTEGNDLLADHIAEGIYYSAIPEPAAGIVLLLLPLLFIRGNQ